MTGTTDATGIPAPKIFISYRRQETAAYAGRLYDTVATQYGQGNVFMDVDLEPGIDFVDRITRAVGSCHVLLVVMGQRWSTVQDEGGNVRIADPEDYVRLEVESALRRAEVTVIPVLVGGARMPDREDLPQELRALTRRNALELSDARWRYDVGRLTTALDQILAEATGVHRVPPSREAASQALPSWRLIVEAAIVGAVAALLASLLADAILSQPDKSDEAGRIIRAIVLRSLTWAVAGAALAVWLTLRNDDTRFVRRGVRGLVIGAIGGAVGGAVFSVPVNLPALDLEGAAADWVDVAGLTVTGGFIGALLGSLWRPPHLAAGLLSGIAAGAVIEFMLRVLLGWSGAGAFAIRGAVLAGAVVGTLVLLHEEQPGAAPAAGMTADRA
jgi:hypothetical protein